MHRKIFEWKKTEFPKTFNPNITKHEPELNFSASDGGSLNMTIGNSSHSGSLEYQEDSFACSDITRCEDKGLAAVVADGMGGLSGGKEISSYVVSSFIKMFGALDYSKPFGNQLKNITEKINNEICNSFNKNVRNSGGSTLAAVFFYRGKAHWVCAGDSRVYIQRENRLYALNEDHDYFNQLLNNHIKGEISLDEIRADKRKDSLTSFIGNEELPLTDYNIKGFPVLKGDSFVLCTDGVYNAVSEPEMVTLVKNNSAQQACDNIIRAALEKNIPRQDNLTVLIISFN